MITSLPNMPALFVLLALETQRHVKHLCYACQNETACRVHTHASWNIIGSTYNRKSTATTTCKTTSVSDGLSAFECQIIRLGTGSHNHGRLASLLKTMRLWAHLFTCFQICSDTNVDQWLNNASACVVEQPISTAWIMPSVKSEPN